MVLLRRMFHRLTIVQIREDSDVNVGELVICWEQWVFVILLACMHECHVCLVFFLICCV